MYSIDLLGSIDLIGSIDWVGSIYLIGLIGSIGLIGLYRSVQMGEAWGVVIPDGPIYIDGRVLGVVIRDGQICTEGRLLGAAVNNIAMRQASLVGKAASISEGHTSEGRKKRKGKG